MNGISPPRRLPVATFAALLATALVAWIVSVARMRGMDAGPGTDLGDLGWYLGIWVTMTAAMMLPSAAPTVLLFATLSRGVRTWIFVAGYVAAWTVYGLVAYGLFRLVTSLGAGWLAWDRVGPYASAGAIAAAGIYQLTPLKAICLRHCRSPLHFVMRARRDRGLGALRMGLAHGLYCVGCCSGLMVILFALGLMSVVWMALVAALVFAEKVLPYGQRLSRPLALGLLVLAIWVASAPASVPGLTEPGTGMGPGSAGQGRMAP
jgi:predicted metal-binding membrane protein